MYTLIRFGSVSLPQRRMSTDLGTGEVEAVVFPLITGGLYDAYGNEKLRRRGTRIRHVGAIYSASTSTLKVDFYALRALIGKKDKLYRQVDSDGSIEWCYARLTNIQATRTVENQGKILDLEFDFLMLSAVWNGSRHGAGWYFDSGEHFDTGLVFDESSGVSITLSGTASGTINNGGNTTVTNPSIQIVAGSAISLIAITKASETSLSYSGAISAGGTLVIDCGARTVKLNGSNAYANFSLGTAHCVDDWMKLDSGVNVISFAMTGGGTTSTAYFSFYDGWE